MGSILIINKYLAIAVLSIITFFLLLGTLVCFIYGTKIFKQKKIISIILFLIAVPLGIKLYEIALFDIFYSGYNLINQKKYEKGIETYQLVANLTINSNLKSFLYGECGNKYLLIPDKGFDAIVLYNYASIYNKSYKLLTNAEIWPHWINKLLIKSQKNNVASNWPLVAAKVYIYEKHYEKAEKIYLTAEKKANYLGLLNVSVIKNKYQDALDYANLLIEEQHSPDSYAIRANIQQILGNKKEALADLSIAINECKKNKECSSRVNNLFKNFSYDCYQNYFEQRKKLGFE